MADLCTTVRTAMKLLEHYTSVQGEGPNTGKPIQFVRFAGCNMRCPGWPCDTPQAIFPDQYTNEYRKVTVDELVLECQKWPRRVCLTGGEPFLQDELTDLIVELLHYGDFGIDIFTNGSFLIPLWVMNASAVTIVMDWKLGGSGEADTRRENRIHNLKNLHKKDAVKFVVKDQDDLFEALELSEQFRIWSVRAPIWVGAAWGHISDADIVEFLQGHKLDWRLNIQTHKHIWDPNERYT